MMLIDILLHISGFRIWLRIHRRYTMKKSGFLVRAIVSLIIFSTLIPFLLGAQTDQDSNESQIEKSPVTTSLALRDVETSPDNYTAAGFTVSSGEATTLPESTSESLGSSGSSTDHTSSCSETISAEGIAGTSLLSSTTVSPADLTGGSTETTLTEAIADTGPFPANTETTESAPAGSPESTATEADPDPEDAAGSQALGPAEGFQAISPLALPPDPATNPNYYIDGVKSNYKDAMSGVGTFTAPTSHDTAALPDTEIPVPEIKKTATPVAGRVNTWDIALEIMARDVRQTADVVLVLDTSGSMSGAKMTAMKAAANTFIDTMLQNDTTRVAIVSYASYAHNSIGFRNSANKQQLKNFVSNTSATGGTFTQDALRAAQIILDTYSSTASSKHIVLLSDGLPTYAYPLTDPNAYLGGELTGRVYESVSNDYKDYPTTNRYDAYRQNEVPASPALTLFDLDWRIGSGNAQHVMYYDGDKTVGENVATLSPTGTYFLYNGGNLYTRSQQGQYSQFNNYTTIGGNRYYPAGNTFYTRTGSRPNYSYHLFTPPQERYTIEFTNQGDGVSRYHFLPANTIAQSKIAQQQGYIVHTVALAVGPDASTGVDGDLVLQDIASTPAHAYKASTDDLQAIFSTIAGSIISSISDAQVTDPLGPGFDLMYSGSNPLFNADGQSVGVNFAAGEATYDPASKTISWNAGALSAPITVNGQTYHYERLTYRIEINDEILDPSVARFTRNPDGTGTATADGNFYRTNDTTTLTYRNAAGSAAAPITFPIPVVNPIFLKVTKILEDSDGNVITDPDLTFAIRVRNNAVNPAYDRTFNLKSGESVTTTDLRLAAGYIVSETLDPDYDVSYEVNGSAGDNFTVMAPSGSPIQDSGQGDIELKVFNRKKIQAGSLTLTGTKTLSGRQLQLNEFTFRLYPANSSGEITGAVLQLTRNAADGSFSFEPISFTEADTYYYLIQEVAGSESGMQYDGREYLLTVTVTVESGVLQPQLSYQVRTPPAQTFSSATSLAFENKLSTDVSVAKLVSGYLGDRSRVFSFEAKVMTTAGSSAVYDITPPQAGAGYSYDADTGLYSFNLKHTENVDLAGLPLTAVLWLRETNTADYTITVTSGTGSGSLTYIPEGGWYKIPITESISIHVENFKDGIPDTGISLDSWPYFLILALAAAGAATFLIIRRRRY